MDVFLGRYYRNVFVAQLECIAVQGVVLGALQQCCFAALCHVGGFGPSASNMADNVTTLKAFQ